MIALLWLAVWSFDRIEPPYAVLVDAQGATHDVPLASLPPEARPGDLLQSPQGPVLPGTEARRAALGARLGRLVGVESPAGVRQAAPMRNPKDHFFRKAKAEGYAARSIYKLEEIDQKVRLFRRGQRVLDLGCAPGSWLQYAAKAVGPKGRVTGIDLKPVKIPMGENVTLLQQDIFATDPATLITGGRFDLVISDMAPATSGNRFSDHVRSVELCQSALHLAVQVLRNGGGFVCKAFEGGDIPALVAEVRPHFREFRRLKPKGTRTESVELYLIGLGFQGGAESATPEPVVDDVSAPVGETPDGPADQSSDDRHGANEDRHGPSED